MKNSLIALTATAVMGFGSIALANDANGPVLLTDGEMSQIVAAGSICGPIYNPRANGFDGNFFVVQQDGQRYMVQAGGGKKPFLYTPVPNNGQGPIAAVLHTEVGIGLDFRGGDHQGGDHGGGHEEGHDVGH